MFRRLCEWYLRRFPKRREPGYYPAKEPWEVAVTITGDSGRFVEYIQYEEDRFDRWLGHDSWDTARYYAESKAYDVRKNGLTVRDGEYKDLYPVHRIYLVQTYPKIEAEDNPDVTEPCL